MKTFSPPESLRQKLLKGSAFILAPLGLFYIIRNMLSGHADPVSAVVESLALILLSHLLSSIVEKHDAHPSGAPDVTDERLGTIEDTLTHLVAAAPNPENPVLTPQLNLDADLFHLAARSQTIYIANTYLCEIHKHIKAIKDSLERGVKYRILVLDPDCRAARARAGQIRLPRTVTPDQYKEEILLYIRTLWAARTAVPHLPDDVMEMQYLVCCPGNPLYLIENAKGQPRKLIQGYYHQITSTQGAHLLWPSLTRSSTIHHFHQHLQDMWRSTADRIVPMHDRVGPDAR